MVDHYETIPELHDTQAINESDPYYSQITTVMNRPRDSECVMNPNESYNIIGQSRRTAITTNNDGTATVDDEQNVDHGDQREEQQCPNISSRDYDC